MEGFIFQSNSVFLPVQIPHIDLSRFSRGDK